MRENNQGVVSLLTTVIIALLLLLLVLGLSSMMVGTLNQSVDSGNSIQAFYAAQAGVEDQLLSIQKALSSGTNNLGGSINTNGCASGNDGPVSSVVYTCAQVTADTTTITGDPGKEQSYQYDLSNLPGLQSVELDWNQAGTDADPKLSMQPGNGQFPTGGAYFGPALMEMVAVSHLSSSGVSSGQLNVHDAILKPVFAGPGNAPVVACYELDNTDNGAFDCSNAKHTAAASPGGPNALPGEVQCGPQIAPGDYNCKAIITGFAPAYDYIVRFRPRYTGTHFQFTAWGASGAKLTVPDEFATVDVTAKDGDVFRRVVNKVQIRSTAYSGLDYALYSDTDIDKTICVQLNGLGSQNNYPNGCP
jgi:hypothetical protein